ncbi:hypothetical protein YC2023_007142 [Brassica napus]
MTVSELNQFVLTADPQVIEFLCTAKVTEIQLDEGWCYIGCSGCSKKLIREDTSFTCVPCDETNAVAKLRYRVILSVSDGTCEATFLGFDTEMSKLTHVHASEAAQIVGIGTNAEVDVVLPRSLTDLVGRTYTFQLKPQGFQLYSQSPDFYHLSRSGDKGATTSSAADQSTVATKADQMEQTARKKERRENCNQARQQQKTTYSPKYYIEYNNSQIFKGKHYIRIQLLKSQPFKSLQKAIQTSDLRFKDVGNLHLERQTHTHTLDVCCVSRVLLERRDGHLPFPLLNLFISGASRAEDKSLALKRKRRAGGQAYILDDLESLGFVLESRGKPLLLE